MQDGKSRHPNDGLVVRPPPNPTTSDHRYGAVVIGTSAGGLDALCTVLGALSPELAVPIVVVQHLSRDADEFLVQYLNQVGSIRVEEVVDRGAMRAGTLYVAPPNYHVLIEVDRSFALSVDPPVNYARPSIDVLFESAAHAYGRDLVGVILTGANSDGIRGARMIRDLGGSMIVQDPASAVASFLPQSALDAGLASVVLPLTEIGPYLMKHVATSAADHKGGEHP